MSKKIFIVFSGSYSDRGTAAVFDNNEAAETFIENTRDREEDGKPRHYDEWDIEEWEVGATCPVAGRTPWRVDIYKNGDIEWIAREPNGTADSEEFHQIYQTAKGFLNENKLIAIFDARSKEHAQKIAGERRARHIADGTWEECRP